MGSDTVENTALRLRAVLEILAAEDPSGKVSRATVISAALHRVPLTGREAEELASGTTRGERALVNATTKLVKAGWILKEGRAGWSITSGGRQALVDFPEPTRLAAALQGNGSAPSAARKTPPAAEVVEEAVRDAVAVPTVPAEPSGSHRDSGDGFEPSFPQPEAVALAGSFGSALGIADWDPAAAAFSFDRHDELWKLTLDLPAGSYEYKVALNGSWEENYGFGAHRDGGNIQIEHSGGPLSFLYDHATHTVLTKPEVSS